MGKAQIKKALPTDRVSTYFRKEVLPLTAVTVTGIIYNVGMTASPWFEGQLAQTLSDILNSEKVFTDMLSLAVSYVLVIIIVQLMRYMKRFYVRRFANDVSLNMKSVLYNNLVNKSAAELEGESSGALMTKAVSDVDACAEGMRKFTTEIFDTGVVMLSYIVMLAFYDIRLTLLSCIFPPLAYFIAARLKKTVSRCAALQKESAQRMSGEAHERIALSLTYRVMGIESNRNAAFESSLSDYEKKAVKAGVLDSALQPLYQIISSVSFVFIIYFGIKNVQGSGFTQWNIAAFTAFVSCFAKLSLKSSKAAKLFNSVQKAKVSWGRIKPFMKAVPEENEKTENITGTLEVKNLSFSYGDRQVLHNIAFTVSAGEKIGITGEVASGKSTLGRVFLCEKPYSGSILYNGTEFSSFSAAQRRKILSYMGHDTQLLNMSVADNLALGDDIDTRFWLSAVSLTDEVAEMPEKADTAVGVGGTRLSGGQCKRLALARTVCRKAPLIVLDDPFSALDIKTEHEVYLNLTQALPESTLLLISHRLTLFSQLDKIIWLENGTATVSTHALLLESVPEYRRMYEAQTKAGASDE